MILCDPNVFLKDSFLIYISCMQIDLSISIYTVIEIKLPGISYIYTPPR